MLKRTKIIGAIGIALATQVVAPVGASLIEDMQLFQYKVTKVDNNSLTHEGDFTETPVLLYNSSPYGKGPEVTVPSKFQNNKEEHRATWVSTVSNIDMPKSSNEADFRAKFQNIVDNAKSYGLNTLIFQVRPMLDAWYQSDINPTSAFILNGGKQGDELSFDPLQIAVEMSHEAGLELHAWFNPYRVTNSTSDYRSKEAKLAELDDKNFAKQNPDLVYEFANKLFLDPGRPEVVNHISDTINEVITKYEVDAIHFDDYFYPYKTAYNKVTGYNPDGTPILTNVTETMRDRLDIDENTFNNFSRGFDDVHKWREDNINTLIKSVRATIDNHNAETGDAVQYGISPFGIWDHKAKNELGSHTPTSSTASLDDYVDTRAWAQNEWVDYLTPQIYWAFNTTFAPYGELVSWWNEQFEGVEKSHLYIGHPNYKIIENTADDFANKDEIPSQLRFNQKLSNIKGSSFFSYNKLDSGIRHASGSLAYRQGVKDESNKIVREYYSVKALPASKPWLDQKETSLVYGLTIEGSTAGNKLIWNDSEDNDTQFYVVYRAEGDRVDTTNPANIFEIVNKKDGTVQFFEDKNADKLVKYTYAVSVLDKAKVESEAVEISLDKVAKEKAAIEAINLLPEVNELKLSDEELVLAARELVTIANNDKNIINLDKLEALEARLVELKEEKENKDKKVQAAIEAINALPKAEELKLSDEPLIVAARELVTIANSDDNITNLDKLVALESRLVELKEEKENQNKKVQAAIEAINALPKVEDLKLSDEQRVVKARELVTIANSNEEITNLDKLVTLEAKLAELKKDKDNQENNNNSNKPSNTNKPNNKPNNKPANGKLPNTGGTAAAGVLSLGTILLGTGGYIFKKRK